jgi:hypothetical protein
MEDRCSAVAVAVGDDGWRRCRCEWGGGGGGCSVEEWVEEEAG